MSIADFDDNCARTIQKGDQRRESSLTLDSKPFPRNKMSSRGGKDILRDENPSQPIASSTASSTLRSFAYTVPLQSVERHEAKLSQKPTLARLHEASADFKTSEEPSTRPPQDPSIYPEVSHNRSVEEQRNAQAMKSEAYLSDSTSANGRDPSKYSNQVLSAW